MIVAVGDDQAGGVSRTVRASYRMRTAATANALGGRIKINTTEDCLDTGAVAAAGVPVLIKACATGSAQQRFGYTADLNVVLIGSAGSTYPRGLCLAAAPVAGTAVKLQPCASPAAVTQQWSYNDRRNFEGTTDGRTLNGFCFNAVGGALVIASQTLDGSGTPTTDSACNRVNVDTGQSFAPEPTVGAGAAGPQTGQLVNFEEFGRCLDVDDGDITRQPMVYPCKQAPDPNSIGWNQKWTLPLAAGAARGSGMIYATNTDKNELYCLTPPVVGATDPRLGFTLCPAGTPPAALTWTVYGRTSDFLTSYRIEDFAGRCLASSPEYVRHPGLANYAIVTTCDSSRIQKWNVDPSAITPALSGLAEK
jgi:hypothetical protein